jgi:KaiC/GvpD/RAD55 family RecA-like ATPase
LNQDFSKTETERLSRSTLLGIITESLGVVDSLEDEENRERIALVLLEALVWVRYLVEESQEGGGLQYERRWRLSAAFFLHRLFGVAPQVTGFDFLLDGALLLPTQTGLTVLMEGEPGTGKTTLSLQWAASLASKQYAVVYLSAEEVPVTLEERLSFAGYDARRRDGKNVVLLRTQDDRGSEVTLRTANSTDALLDSSRKGQAGSISASSVTIASVANRTAALQAGNSDLLGNLQTIFKDLKERGIPSCLVVDSIDGILPDGRRRELEDLFNFGRYFTDVCVVVAEAERPDSRRASEYLADMVINLGYRTRLEGFSERVIEIKKCRTQAHIRGQQMFSIYTGGGVTIYPSVQAKLSVWRRRIRRSLEPQTESWRLDDSFDLDPILRGDLIRGDAILVMGEPATHKLPLGLSFLAAGLNDPMTAEKRDENLLLISLREDEATIRLAADNYPQFRRLTEALHSEGERPRMRVMHFPPDYFSAERCLFWVERTLGNMKRRGERVSRVLFNSLSQLRYSSPMFSREPLFVAALIELFKKEGITSLFISVTSGKTPPIQLAEEREVERDRQGLVATDNSMSQEIGNIFDTIIFTGKRQWGGREEVVLTVGHTGKCNAVRDPMVLRRPTVSIPGPPQRAMGRLELDSPHRWRGDRS